MTTCNISRIAGPNAEQQLEALQKKLSLQGDIVSEKGRRLTETVFGEALPPARVVDRICSEVRDRGLEAVLHYTEKLDGVALRDMGLQVPAMELSIAHNKAEPAFLETIRRVRQNILSYQLGLLHRDATLTAGNHFELRMRYRPIRRVGICIPGGAASYPSTLLMTVCPAQAAGVKEIVVMMPPTQTGAFSRDMLATCQELGVTEVFRVGGAQGVAAMAYGIETVLPRVDMIVGPGNIFVTLAKKFVFGQVAIDMLAGPSEVVVIADDSAVPEYVAADLIAQAEHSPGSSVLITWHEPLIDQVSKELDKQLAVLSRGDLARQSLEEYGALALARNEEQAISWANRLASEHVHVQTRNAVELADRIDCAGAIFIGHETPVALGDYAAGPSHVLPTGGTARFASCLSVNDFLRRSSVVSFNDSGLRKMAADVRFLAHKEGLPGHAASIDVRLHQGKNGVASSKPKSVRLER